jgi:hypothetical protein
MVPARRTRQQDTTQVEVYHAERGDNAGLQIKRLHIIVVLYEVGTERAPLPC